ncbi:MAG: NAD-dependent epimerase/dehydratase family protein [Geodermatophilaceae bacterium]|nr:NAD-dependent epimerase/dehydratase family protein [Geodermatophilaceae bacterium]
MTPKVVLVAGVSRYLGARLARTLCDVPSIERVIGVDALPPSRELRANLGRTEFVRADIRNPLIGKVITTAGVDTVVHMNIRAAPHDSGGRSSMKEMNVIGTMQLLAACQKAETVRRLVVKSTTAVYGSSPRDPAMFTETMEPRSQPSSGYAKDAMEIEGYIRGFARRRPDVTLSVLRFTNFIGPHVASVLTEYFAMPVVPTVLGFDPRLQVLHEDDALEVLLRATLHELPGVFNVGADGVMLLSQAIRRAGRVGLPLPGFTAGIVDWALGHAGGLDYTTEQRRFLNHGRVVDTTRLKADFGYRPRYTTLEAFDDFVRGRNLRPVIDPARLASVQAHVLRLTRRLGRV